MSSSASTAVRHAGVPETLRQLTQASFVIRLAAVLIAMLATVGTTWDLVDVIAVVVVGALSFAGLMQTRYLTVVRRHPIIALLDTLVVAVTATLSGPDNPLILAVLSTALLVGLWVDVWSGLITVAALTCLYVVSLTTESLTGQGWFTSGVVLPFVFVTFWALGLVVARSSRRQQVGQALVRDAVATAAASEERTKMARELHDSLAKTLQGLTLTATAIPALMETNPDLARTSSDELRRMGVLAVSQVREVMTGLRERTSDLPLSTGVVHLVVSWEERHDRRVDLDVEELDTTDETVRYELLTVCEEALDNVARHAGPCRVEVGLSLRDGDIVLRVRDHGRGADMLALTAAGRAGHRGVIGMHERMARIGGFCDVVTSPGEGMTVECRVNHSGLVER